MNSSWLKPSRAARACVWLVAFALVSCSPQRDNPVAPASAPPESTGDGILTIVADEAKFAWSGVVGVDATIANPTDREFHARLGDGFNAAIEQSTLYAADGSDGFVELWDSDSGWEEVPRVPMDEGVGSVVIRPHTTYRLIGYFEAPKTPGFGAGLRESFRLRVRYFDDPAAPIEQAHQDYSNTFIIK
jgi:hypothetical protein